MSNKNEQNVLKLNLFQALNDNRDMSTNFSNSRRFSKDGNFIMRQSFDKSQTTQHKSQNQWYDENARKIKKNINLNNINNKNNENIQKESISSPTRRQKSIEINKKAAHNAYLKQKVYNQKQKEERLNQQYSLNCETSFTNNYNHDICLSYSRTLSSFKDIKANDFNRTMIKNLIGKKNINHNTRYADQSDKELQDKYLNEPQKDQNSLGTERLYQKNNFIVQLNQNELNALQTNESFSNYPINNINHENFLSLKKIDIKQSTSERNHLKNKTDNIQIKNEQKLQNNTNTYNQSNELKTLGNPLQLKKYDQDVNNDEIQKLSNQIIYRSSKRKVQTVYQSSVRQKQGSILELSPDLSRTPLNGYESNQDLYKINIPYNKIQKKKVELQNMQFYALPTNQNEFDQLYSQQFQNVIIPVTPQKYLGSPQNKLGQSQITLQVSNIKSNPQVRVPAKISAKFRQSLKESIERHTTREQEQILEIQKLLSEYSATGISATPQIKEQIISFQNYEGLIKSSQIQTQQQFNKIKQSDLNHKQNSRQTSYENFFDMNIQQNQLSNIENVIQKSKETNNEQQLDAKQVFENLPFYKQSNEYNYSNKTDTNEKQYNNTFTLSKQTQKNRNYIYQDKKIYKV